MSNHDKYPNETILFTTTDDYVAIDTLNNGLGVGFIIKNTGGTNSLKYTVGMKLSGDDAAIEKTVVSEATLAPGAESDIIAPVIVAYRRLIIYAKSAAGSSPTTGQLDIIQYS